MKEYVITHLHTMNSNSILADSPSKLEDYLKEIKNKDGIRGIIRTEHGHCQNWFKTYQLMEKYNYKYIHAVEGYTCLNGDDKYNFHILLYGLNFLGFLICYILDILLLYLYSIGYNSNVNYTYTFQINFERLA